MKKEECELCNRSLDKCDCENLITLKERDNFLNWIWKTKAGDLK